MCSSDCKQSYILRRNKAHRAGNSAGLLPVWGRVGALGVTGAGVLLRVGVVHGFQAELGWEVPCFPNNLTPGALCARVTSRAPGVGFGSSPNGMPLPSTFSLGLVLHWRLPASPGTSHRLYGDGTMVS